MSFRSMVRRTRNPNEHIYLEHLQPGERDAVGSFEEEWVQVKELLGVIQKPAENKQFPHGDEEVGTYRGYFTPEYEIPYATTPDYRIRHVIPGEKDRYYEITRINRNLFFRGKRHHYELDLELSRKWYNPQ